MGGGGAAAYGTGGGKGSDGVHPSEIGRMSVDGWGGWSGGGAVACGEGEGENILRYSLHRKPLRGVNSSKL